MRYKLKKNDIIQWEGVVIEILPNSFIADLYELDQDIPEIEAEIPFEEISLGDRKLIEIGASFDWTLKYESSKIIFHKPIIMTKEMLRNIHKRAKEKMKELKESE